jgi:hypothetical protein
MAGIENPPGGEAPAEAPAAEPSLRDTLDAAFEEAATGDEAGAPPPPAGDRATRDPAGRFARQAPAEAPEGAAKAPEGVPQGVTRPAPRPGAVDGQGNAPAEGGAQLRPPAQWKPEAREQWQAVPAGVQAEITRREREFQTHLQQSAELRQFVSAFEDIVRPYEMFIRAENSNPLAAVQNLFQTAAELRVGTPQAKALMVAGLVQQYGIDLRQLDTALAQRFGVPTNGINPQVVQQPTPQTFQDPRVDQFLYMQQQAAEQAAQRETAEIQSATQEFAEAHEFFMDVKDDMADMIEIAARRGIVLPVKEAYEKACQLNPDVRKILAQRSTAPNARANTQAALRAKRAASSIKGESSPHGVTTSTDGTLRGDIEAAFESAGGTRL